MIRRHPVNRIRKRIRRSKLAAAEHAAELRPQDKPERELRQGERNV